MTLIQFQQNATVSGADVRTEQLDGKEWLVAPAVVIVAGVLNGLLVPAAEIEISTMSWNGRSIPVHHPNTTTANEPMTVQNQVIGYFYGANFQTDRLHGEMWFDVAKANALGGDAAIVIENVQSGGMIEVSTAYWAYTTLQAGEFNGVPYTGITTHILPDHIAVLPGDEGACNVSDGCGVPRKNQRSESMDKDALQESKSEDVVENELANCNNEVQKTFLKQVKNYVQNLFQNHEKERQMKDMINAIVQSGKTGLTAEQLKGLPETAVAVMFNGLELNEGEPEGGDGSTGGNAPSEPTQPQAETMPAWAADLATRFGELATKVDGLSATQNAAAEQQKSGIIAKLVANERVTFSAAELKAFTLPQLEKLATSFIEPDYSGLFFGENNTSDGYEYVGLTINSKEEAK